MEGGGTGRVDSSSFLDDSLSEIHQGLECDEVEKFFSASFL